ncbi:MAG: cupin [Rhodospirillaceae bacterium]|jgi:mannose-6-phosphate isomerase-like protein (cupin superfamily)|nr:cupin [Rhodospirillaceae bacterium]|tara:strand:- start:4 stop:387 length:384 start_codon:yes stop_codon:yes gene_type:complete
MASQDDTTGRKAVIHEGAAVMWEDLPGHFLGAYSKLLVRPENESARIIDFRVSCYQPKGYVAPHTHKIQEQVYHILSGEGLMETDGARQVVRENTTIFIPPGVEHALYNTGNTDLTFIVVTAPPEDE